MIALARKPTSVRPLFGKLSLIGRHTYTPSTTCGRLSLTFQHTNPQFDISYLQHWDYCERHCDFHTHYSSRVRILCGQFSATISSALCMRLHFSHFCRHVL